MITQPPRVTDERFNVMMSLFSYDSPQSQNGRSVLCRVLDGRGLDDVCPVDQMILTPEERARYSHLRPIKSKALAYRTRAELRRMLGREIGLPPQMVPLLCSAHGKPVCPHPLASGLAFSVAHAEDCAMIALGEVDGVGVDMERVIPREPAEELLTILFDDDEQEQWRLLAPPLRCRAFTEAWTIKEAVLKAIGTGLDGSPHDVTVTFDHMGRATPVFNDANWIFERVAFCPCYTACLIAVVPERGGAVRERKVTAIPAAA
jgi:4'-phosphopantetheinyl transferase